MIEYIKNRPVRVLSLKENVFICIFNQKYMGTSCSQKESNEYTEKLKKLSCDVNPYALASIKNGYRDIRDKHNLSLESALDAIDVEIFASSNLQRKYKIKVTSKYRALIIEALEKTKEQIIKNSGKVNICDIAHGIFDDIQPLSGKIKKLKVNNNLTVPYDSFLKEIRKAYNQYSLSSEAEKENNEYCTERAIDIIDAMIFGANNSTRINYLDAIADKLANWYFVKPQKNYNYLIFQPKDLMSLKEHLFDVIDNTPFGLFLKANKTMDEDGNVISFNLQEIDDLDSCLHAEYFLTYKDIEKVQCLRELKKDFEIFLSSKNNPNKTYDVLIYNISEIKAKKIRKENYLDVLKEVSDQDLLLVCNYDLIKINNILIDLRRIISNELKVDALKKGSAKIA